MNIRERLYHDFGIQDQIKTYEKLIAGLKDAGYQFYTVCDFEKVTDGGKVDKLPSDSRYCIMRRDIDTRNDKLLIEMSTVEKSYGVNCTYYFRWATFNPKIIDYIASNGSEVSYHYEEIATFAKKNYIRVQSEIWSNIEVIQEIFRDNYSRFKDITVLPCKTVASHGEWINRALKIANHVLLNDQLRQELGIIRET